MVTTDAADITTGRKKSLPVETVLLAVVGDAASTLFAVSAVGVVLVAVVFSVGPALAMVVVVSAWLVLATVVGTVVGAVIGIVAITMYNTGYSRNPKCGHCWDLERVA